MTNTLKRVVFLLLPVFALSQGTVPFKKGSLLFEAGPDYRITPISEFPGSTSFGPGDFGGFVNVDAQNTGLGINLALEYFILNKFSLGFANTIRYAAIFDDVSSIQLDFGPGRVKRDLLFDYHIYLNKYFSLSDTKAIYISAGFALLNTNSGFIGRTSFFDENGEFIATAFSDEENAFFATRYELGYKSGGVKFGLGIFTSSNTDYFPGNTRFTIPFIKIAFNLGKF